jgi:hypothetical protein
MNHHFLPPNSISEAFRSIYLLIGYRLKMGVMIPVVLQLSTVKTTVTGKSTMKKYEQHIFGMFCSRTLKLMSCSMAHTCYENIILGEQILRL